MSNVDKQEEYFKIAQKMFNSKLFLCNKATFEVIKTQLSEIPEFFCFAIVDMPDEKLRPVEDMTMKMQILADEFIEKHWGEESAQEGS